MRARTSRCEGRFAAVVTEQEEALGENDSSLPDGEHEEPTDVMNEVVRVAPQVVRRSVVCSLKILR